jgi:hypothetical protein
MSFCTRTRDTPYSRATSLLLRPSIVTAVITSRAIDMAHLRAKEGANYVSGQEIVMTERELERRAQRRLAVLRHVEEVSGNVAATCRYDGISRQCY